jgi:hypothetical protein
MPAEQSNAKLSTLPNGDGLLFNSVVCMTPMLVPLMVENYKYKVGWSLVIRCSCKVS